MCLVAQTGAQAPRDLTDGSPSVRGKVGYGGGEFTTTADAVIFAGADGRLYRLALDGGLPTPITPEFGAAAAPRISADGKWIAYVHSAENVDGIALVDAQGEQFPRKLAYGTDFVMQPAWSPDGAMIAYVAWNQPQMPWDGTELRLAHLTPGSDGAPAAARVETIAGDATTSIVQPEFSPDGRMLAYASDKNGWWQLYLYDFASQSHIQLTDAEAEDSVPAWVQGIRTYAWSHDGKAIYFIRNQASRNSLWRVDVGDHKLRRITALDGYSSLGQIAASSLAGEVALIAGASTIPDRVISYEIDHPTMATLPAPSDPPNIEAIVDDERDAEWIRKRSRSEMLMARYAPTESISWTGQDGGTVYGLYTAPLSPNYEMQRRAAADRQGSRRTDQSGALQLFAGSAVLRLARLRFP